MILACPHLAAPTRSAKRWDRLQPAPAYQATLDDRPTAGQSAPATLSVPPPWRASTSAAKTLVPARAVLMRPATLSSISPSVVVRINTPETHSQAATQRRLRPSLMKYASLAIHLRVELMLSAESETEPGHAAVRQITLAILMLNVAQSVS